VQVVLSPYRVELEKSRCETEHSLDEVPGVLAVFELDEAPYYSSSCRREQEYRMGDHRRLLLVSGRVRESIAVVIGTRTLAITGLTPKQTPRGRHTGRRRHRR